MFKTYYVRNNFLITLSCLCTLLLYTNRVHAEDHYVIIAEATIPALTESAQSISKFSDQVSQGSSILLAGGIIALSFQLNDVIISSELRILLYADSSGKNPAPLIAFIANPSGSKTPSRIKFNKFKFPSKKIGNKLFIAENASLLNAITTIPPELKTDSAVLVKLYPEKYFTDCKGTVAAFTAKIEQEFSKGRKKKEEQPSKDMKTIESLLKQCQTISLTLDAASDVMALDLSILPKPETAMAKTLQTVQGKLSEQDIVNLSEKMTNSQDFIITNEIKNALSFLLSRIFENSDTDSIAEKLCKFKISADNSKLNLNIAVTPKQAKDILITTGVLRQDR